MVAKINCFRICFGVPILKIIENLTLLLDSMLKLFSIRQIQHQLLGIRIQLPAMAVVLMF